MSVKAVAAITAIVTAGVLTCGTGLIAAWSHFDAAHQQAREDARTSLARLERDERCMRKIATSMAKEQLQDRPRNYLSFETYLAAQEECRNVEGWSIAYSCTREPFSCSTE